MKNKKFSYFKHMKFNELTHLRVSSKKRPIEKEYFFGEEDEYFDIEFKSMIEISLDEFRKLLELHKEDLSGKERIELEF